MTFWIYILFIISFFIRLTARIPLLGVVRFDLILMLLIFILLLFRKEQGEKSELGKILLLIMAYSIISIPFVKWPGSVIHYGIPGFLKALVFYFFTVPLLDSKKRLHIFLFIFLICQCFRVIEPVYLHLTQGYWGSSTHLGEGMMMARLAGSAYDVANPNGLAQIIMMLISFLYYFLLVSDSKKKKLLFFLFIPILLYALFLSASRSGLLGLFLFSGLAFLKARRKLLFTAGLMIAALFIITHLEQTQVERYLSIIGRQVRGAETAKGRLEGVKNNFRVALQRPIAGFGLGTSREANVHVMGNDQTAHNLYAEILTELGPLGLLLYLLFLKKMWSLLREQAKLVEEKEPAGFMDRFFHSLKAFFLLNLLFSLASYGLATYEWYLVGGLTVSATNIMRNIPDKTRSVPRNETKAVCNM